MKTRRNLLIVIFVFCWILTATSQPVTYYGGIKAGFGIPNLTTGADATPLNVNYSSRLGFYGGFAGEIHKGKHLGLRVEINYSSQGGKRNGLQALPLIPELEPLWQILPTFGVTPDKYMYADIRNESVINYLEIPVMAKYTWGLSSKINFYMQAGPYFGFLINAKEITGGSSEIYVDKDGAVSIDQILEQASLPTAGPQSFDNTASISSDIHKFNVGGQGTLGFEVITASGKLFIEGGGNYGFLPIQKDKENGNNHTGAGTVTIGYLLEL